MIGIVLDGRGEQRVDEGGFPEAGFTSNLRRRESEPSQKLTLTFNQKQGLP